MENERHRNDKDHSVCIVYDNNINILCAENAKLFNVTSGGIYSYLCDLDG